LAATASAWIRLVQLWALTGLYEALAKTSAEAAASLLWYLSTCLIHTVLYFTRESCSISIELWIRRKLTTSALNIYLKNDAYLALKARPELDNPDQRIAEDAAQVANRSVMLGLSFFSEIVAFVSFFLVLYECGLSLGSSNLQLLLPGFALLISGIGTLCGLYLGRRLAPLENQRELSEATFRNELLLIREQAFQIASMNEESYRNKLLQSTFAVILKKQSSWLFNRLRLESFRLSERDLNKVIPLAIIGWLALPTVPISLIMKTVGAFVAVVESSQWLVKHLTSVRTLKAAAWRLGTFLAQLHTIPGRRLDHDVQGASTHPLQEHLPRWCRQIAELHLAAGDWMLLHGCSGCGKSSLLAALHMTFSEAMLIPHNYRLHVGDLKSLCDPHDRCTLHELQYHLRQLGLQHLCDDLLFKRAWGDILSGGEQKRLAILNAALQKPHWILVDEPFAVLDSHSAQLVTSWLKAHSSARIIITAHTEPPATAVAWSIHIAHTALAIQRGCDQLQLQPM